MKSGILLFFMTIFSLVFFSSCEYFKETPEEREVLARVNESYLYKEDIEALIDENTTVEDSTLIVSNFITRWATQQLLIDRAKYNLNAQKQKEFDDLVEIYKNELYTKAYADALVTRRLDTTIFEEEIKAYFDENQGNFRLNEDLFKLRFISLDKNTIDLQEVKRKFIRFNQSDRNEIDKMSLQFKAYSFNDSAWVSSKTVYEKIAPLNAKNSPQLINKNKFVELEDSTAVYLIYVKDVLLRNAQAPLEYANPTIKQILLNKRKSNLVKELEKDITKDAIEKKQFEIYN